MNKVIKLGLICEQVDKDGEPVDHKDVFRLLWELQRQTRELKNKTIQYCWEYSGFSSDYYKANHKYPKEKDILSYTLGGFVDNKLRTNYDLYSANCSITIRGACEEFKNAKSDMIKGTRSIINYKDNQPLELHNKAICLSFQNDTFYVDLSLLKRSAFKKLGYKDSKIHFKVYVKDRSTRTILERCFDGEYHICASQMIYDKRKKRWFLNLGYSFDAKAVPGLEPERVLGVDLGVKCPICASVYGDLARFVIDGGEIEEFRRRVEARKLSMLKQGKNCGDGRRGHGIAARNKPVYAIEDKIARFRDTANHKYSHALLNYAVKNGCGVIQMEELTGITRDANRFLKNWSYYDLQTKIKYKAKEAGIKVVFIKPGYTSQRCSKCGYIDHENRPTQAKFICQKCGFEENADYNASQNIAIPGIDKIIEQELKTQCGSEADT